MFRMLWNSQYRLEPGRTVIIRDSGDGQRIAAGDEIYVIAYAAEARLLGRLSVQSVNHDPYRSRMELVVGGPRSAIFFRRIQNAREVRIAEYERNRIHREAILLDEDDAGVLSSACGAHDFSASVEPINWRGIMRRAGLEINQARRRGNTRPAVEIAERYLRENYVTSQLPGPSPVYLNAARLALGSREGAVRAIRRRRSMTWETIRNGINDDVATTGSSPDTVRHQEILNQLRLRLEELGLVPQYDGYVDCIVECDAVDIYFEVKSCTSDTVTHQVRTGLGQVLHYMWMDGENNPRTINGHLVVQGPWSGHYEELKSFVESCSIRLTWSDEIPSLTVGDLDPI